MSYPLEPDNKYRWLFLGEDLALLVDNFKLLVLMGPHRTGVARIPTATRAEAEAVIRGLEAVAAEVDLRFEGWKDAVRVIPCGPGLRVDVHNNSIAFHAGGRICPIPSRSDAEAKAIILTLHAVMDEVEIRYHDNQGFLDVLHQIRARAQAVQTEGTGLKPMAIAVGSDVVTTPQQTMAGRMVAYLRANP